MWKFFKRGKVPQAAPKEIPDPMPFSSKLEFSRPLSLQEQVNRAVNAALITKMKVQADRDSFDPPEESDEEFHSEHELFHDPRVGKEISKAEMRFLDEQERIFNAEVERRRKTRRTNRQSAQDIVKNSNRSEKREEAVNTASNQERDVTT